MTLPTNSVAPPAPVQSSPAVAGIGFRRWFTGITEWIAGLTPTGQTAYDTGWVALTPVAGFTLSADATVRRIGNVIYFRGIATGTFAANANATLGTVPSGFRPPGNDGRAVGAGATTGGQSVYYMNSSSAGDLLARVATAGSHTVALGGYSGYTVN